ncbi:FCD domain-containing protein [Corynebacterium poyangense]|uniref:FCD domain-containing protein n=1 Tax=Corynebacterium poyangense TaxID=2684405 RepID=A0A7H0SQT0_9CORY|nr:FCD domain-containing protein [Corynebacterium poyangense]MBZ8178214.1 FCD domain-containing protein [Corynebacterium poyangense]QNQ90905.1 FCD domain-containing protein [Corynebacterium poyangense]
MKDQQCVYPTAVPILDSVLDVIAGDIITGRIKPGQVFTLNDIGQRFDISRTVSREVMRALEQRGLASASRRVGITVLDRSHWNAFDPLIIRLRLEDRELRIPQLRSLNELRIGIEPLAARRSAEFASEAQRERLVELAAELACLGNERKANTQEFLIADCEFHSVLLEASHNEMFSGLTPLLLMVLQARTAHRLQPATPAEGVMDHHVDLAQAIARGDGAEAERLTHAILAEVNAFLES